MLHYRSSAAAASPPASLACRQQHRRAQRVPPPALPPQHASPYLPGPRPWALLLRGRQCVGASRLACATPTGGREEMDTRAAVLATAAAGWNFKPYRLATDTGRRVRSCSGTRALSCAEAAGRIGQPCTGRGRSCRLVIVTCRHACWCARLNVRVTAGAQGRTRLL